MKDSYLRLLENNKIWAAEKIKENPKYFQHLAELQTPEFLWIGCSDSRVPANEITGTDPGEIFVHRNVANLVVHTDLNMLSVLQFSVEVLKVKHVIVCGHYGCGGVKYAMDTQDHGLVNKWLRNIKEIHVKYDEQLSKLTDVRARADRLVELNVIEGVRSLAKTSIVQKAWKTRSLQIHGWVYGLENGLIKDLNVMVNGIADLEPIFRLDV
ncbi:MAG TPA: carbonic anhydrase [Leptospiraceae bacterium]|nr:carbonic anhydrase [Leptospirales bacterium]HMW61276.1 carbonic anhydrase [Leptospiraceae bacterium]HMX56544.1 carbonic anhydrase [Leptospiraceae bacterium]HMY46359.1 carbonic anhydrase [Leptospiraceae bacterium]HMZ35289.1 carbonic anhydrase [Leptospiraceae bacterium]